MHTHTPHSTNQQDNPLVYAYGMMWTLIIGGLWQGIACVYGWNVSATHSIIGASAFRLSIVCGMGPLSGAGAGRPELII